MKKKLTKINEIQSDMDLIERFSKGCEKSFEELIKRYETKVHNLAMRLTRNPEDAEEVLQDVFITVYRKVSGFEGKSQFSSWLYRITVNASFMKLRKNKQEQAISIEDVGQQVYNKPVESGRGFGAQSDNIAITNEIGEALEGAIAKLPEEYRAVFILRDIDGLSNKEVGEILDLTIPAVKSRLHRSRLMLRKKLQNFYSEYSSSTTKTVKYARMMQKAA